MQSQLWFQTWWIIKMSLRSTKLQSWKLQVHTRNATRPFCTATLAINELSARLMSHMLSKNDQLSVAMLVKRWCFILFQSSSSRFGAMCCVNVPRQLRMLLQLGRKIQIIDKFQFLSTFVHVLTIDWAHYIFNKCFILGVIHNTH